MKFLIASNNKNKIKEFNRILSPLNISALSAEEMGISLDDVEETGKTFEENAIIKAKSACEKSGMVCIADDSGLVIDALDGRPGIYSARYAGENASDEDKINKVLEEMVNVPDGERTAKFVCVICCMYPNGEKIIVRGECNGTIGFAARGEGGFGYDPIFFTDDNVTFAELTPSIKDAISHRGRALRLLSEELIKKYK